MGWESAQHMQNFNWTWHRWDHGVVRNFTPDSRATALALSFSYFFSMKHIFSNTQTSIKSGQGSSLSHSLNPMYRHAHDIIIHSIRSHKHYMEPATINYKPRIPLSSINHKNEAQVVCVVIWIPEGNTAPRIQKLLIVYFYIMDGSYFSIHTCPPPIGAIHPHVDSPCQPSPTSLAPSPSSPLFTEKHPFPPWQQPDGSVGLYLISLTNFNNSRQ